VAYAWARGFNVEGFITSVVPFFRNASPDPAVWGWWIYDGTAWIEAEPPAVGTGEFQVVSFDEDGVREH
jgi:hypothetical protein